MKWLNKFTQRVSYLDVAILNYFASIFLCMGIILEKRYWWVYLFLFLNIISMISNLIMSWKKDEFNRRKYKEKQLKIKG